MLRKLYDWMMGVAAGPHALPALAAVSFIESSVFPILPDVLLIPMVIARPHRAWLYALLATLFSVLGGFLGYAIGYYAWDTIGQPIFEFYHIMDKYEALKASFAAWGAWIIIAKGWTPIPFKLITIMSGALKFDLLSFAVAALVSRSLRFFLVAALLRWYGDPVRVFIERRLTLVTSAFVVLLIGSFVAIRYIFPYL